MHLAILMTNTDESAFAQDHPKDGEKFEQLIQTVRPKWRVTSYAVKDGEFPSDIKAFDGFMISGSPASVRDTDPWVARLFDLIRNIHAQNIPMFGACFGHQAIAIAMGGEVGPNPGGWVFGLTQAEFVRKAAWMRDLPKMVKQYAAHIEQVTKLPEAAEILATNSSCHVGGFNIGDMVYTTQNHPEMTPEFMEALVAEYAPKLPSDVALTAKASLAGKADTLAYAQSIAQFFEYAANLSSKNPHGRTNASDTA